MFGHCLLWRVTTGFVALSLGLAHLCSARMAAAGESGSLKFSKRCLMVNPNEGCAIGDVNRDGKPDIIAGTHWFAAPDFIPRPIRDIPQISLGFGSKGFYANNGDHVYDVDGDGRGELITGKRVRGHGGRDPGAQEPACLFYYTWDSAAGKFIRHTISGPGGGVGTGMQIRVADLNGDGRPDITVAGKTSTWLLINESTKK